MNTEHTIKNLSNKHKRFKIKMSDKSSYFINGIEKNKMMDIPSQFVELPTGDSINKAFIVSINFDIEETKAHFDKLDQDEKLLAFEDNAIIKK